LPKIRSIDDYAKLAKRLTNRAMSGRGTGNFTGQAISRVDSELNKIDPMTLRINAMRSKLAPVDARKAAVAKEQAQNAFIGRMRNIGSVLEQGKKAQKEIDIINHAKAGIHGDRGLSTRDQIYDSTHSRPINELDQKQTYEDVKAAFGGPLSTKELIEHNTGGLDNIARTNMINDARAAFTSKKGMQDLISLRAKNARALPAGTDDSAVWDAAMKTAEGGTFGDFQTAYRKLNTNNRVTENIAASRAARANTGFGKFAHKEDWDDYVDSVKEKVQQEEAAAKKAANEAKEAEEERVAKEAEIEGREAAVNTSSMPPKESTYTPPEGYSSGAGGETPAAPKAEEPVPQNAGSSEVSGFGGGKGSEESPLDSFFDEQIGTKGISNAKKHHLKSTRDKYQEWRAEMDQLNKKGLEGEEYNKELNKINDYYGIKADANPLEHFKSVAGEDPSTWDWVRGNNVIEIGAGGALAAGAIASCFSNKGKMSNSELYGQNF